MKKKNLTLDNLLYDVYRSEKEVEMKPKLVSLEDLLQNVKEHDDKEVNTRFRILFD